jgi:8'-apo-carotenoid 13,14-cleaving dioxygenase
VIDICTYDRMFVHDVNGPFGDAAPRLERWTLTPANRRSSVTTIDTTPQEFPRHAPAVGNRPYRYGYSVAIGADAAGATLKHDLLTGSRTSYDYGPGRGAGEAVFVPRESASAEDDGWLLAFTHEADGNGASFVVLDAQDVARGPVAEVALPKRIPYGFHGNWISDHSVPPSTP